MYDVGSSLVEVASATTRSAHQAQSLTYDTRELIWGFITALSNTRGTKSYLLPALLQCSQGIFDWYSPLSLDILIREDAADDETEAGGQAWSLTSSDEVICSSSEVYADDTIEI